MLHNLKIRPIKKNKTVKYGSTNFSYADLPEVVDAITPALEKAEISVRHRSDFKDGTQLFITEVVDKDNDIIASTMDVMPLNLKPQDRGSWSTYLRRYHLSELFNLVTEDDNDCVHLSSQKPFNPQTDYNIGGAKKAERNDRLGEMFKLAKQKNVFIKDWKGFTPEQIEQKIDELKGE